MNRQSRVSKRHFLPSIFLLLLIIGLLKPALATEASKIPMTAQSLDRKELLTGQSRNQGAKLDKLIRAPLAPHREITEVGTVSTATPVAFRGYLILSIALLLFSTHAAATEGTVTYKKALIHDPAPNTVIRAGDDAVSSKDFDGAMQRYQKAASNKDETERASALNRIGELSEWGLGVRRDYATSFKYFQKAALLGNPYAQANLGNAYFLHWECKGTSQKPNAGLNKPQITESSSP